MLNTKIRKKINERQRMMSESLFRSWYIDAIRNNKISWLEDYRVNYYIKKFKI